MEENTMVREICLFKANSMQDGKEIAETLLSGCTVVLNLEGLNFDSSQRILDFTAGACYAIDGEMAKISDNVFIIGPEGVDINGDLVGVHEKENDISISEIVQPEIINFVKPNPKRTKYAKR